MRDSALLFPSHGLQPEALTVQGKTRWDGTCRRRRKLRDSATARSGVLVCDREEDTRGIWEAQVVTPKAESSSGALFDTSVHCTCSLFRDQIPTRRVCPERGRNELGAAAAGAATAHSPRVSVAVAL